MGVTAAPPADTCCQCSVSDFVRVSKEGGKEARRALNGYPSVNIRVLYQDRVSIDRWCVHFFLPQNSRFCYPDERRHARCAGKASWRRMWQDLSYGFLWRRFVLPVLPFFLMQKKKKIWENTITALLRTRSSLSSFRKQETQRGIQCPAWWHRRWHTRHPWSRNPVNSDFHGRNQT